MAEITETDVRQYVGEAASTEDILRALAVANKLQTGDLDECRSFNAALIAVAITEARFAAKTGLSKVDTQAMLDAKTWFSAEEAQPAATVPETTPEASDRQLLHRALHRTLRLPR